MTTDVLDNKLESMGVRNMLSDSDESEDNDSYLKFGVDWVERVVNNVHKRSESLDISEKLKKKQKRRWKCPDKLLYSSPMFYRDFHSPTCRKLGHKDAIEVLLLFRNVSFIEDIFHHVLYLTQLLAGLRFPIRDV